MPDRIFFLPENDGALVDGETRAWCVARLIEAIPDDWSDVSGMLDSTDPGVARDTGCDFHRRDSGPRIVARSSGSTSSSTPGETPRVVRPDPVALLVDGRPPGFVSFDDTGYGATWQFLVARTLAAGFVRRGYRGWLSINNGRGRKYADEVPAWVDVHLSPWSCCVGVSAPRRAAPPVVVLSWDERCGGSLAQLEPVHEICRRSLREWTGGLGGLGGPIEG